MCAWVDCSIVGWPFPGNGRRIYVLALVTLELRLREFGVFQTRRGIIGASGLLHLVRESWNRNPKQWIQSPQPNARDQRLDFIQRPLPSDKTIPCL